MSESLAASPQAQHTSSDPQIVVPATAQFRGVQLMNPQPVGEFRGTQLVQATVGAPYESEHIPVEALAETELLPGAAKPVLLVLSGPGAQRSANQIGQSLPIYGGYHRGRVQIPTSSDSITSDYGGWDAALNVHRGGYALLRSFPCERFGPWSLESNARVRFDDIPRLLRSARLRFFTNTPEKMIPMNTRFVQIEQDHHVYRSQNSKRPLKQNGKVKMGTQKFFYDGHHPVGKVQHPFIHGNLEKGAAQYLRFNHGVDVSDHMPLPAGYERGASFARWVRLGGRVFLVAGVLIDTYSVGTGAVKSYQTGDPQYVGREVLRVGGGAIGAGAGMAGFAYALGVKGAVVGSALGPVGTLVGGVACAAVGGVLGALAGNVIGDWWWD